MVETTHEAARPAADRRWLIATRITATGPVWVALGVTAWARLSTLRDSCSEFNSFAAFAFWFMTLPYIIGFAETWGRSAPKLKNGLAWIIVAGGFWGVVVPVLALNGIHSLAEVILPLLWTLLQAAMITSAVRTYYSMPREKGDVGMLLKRGVLFVPYLVVVGAIFAALPDYYSSKRDQYATSAVRALREINKAEAAYAQAYAKGYTPSLAALGSDSNGATLKVVSATIDAALSRGAKDQYSFQYTPGTPNSSGQITSYNLTATPSEPACTLWKRFFTDQTGTIRVSQGNRPATADDPAWGE